MNNVLLDRLRTAVHDAIEAHAYPSEDTHPVGCVLSGGIDSSTITMLAREARDGAIPTFTGWYEGDLYDERKWARLVAGDNWHQVQITPQDFVENIDAVIKLVDGKQVGPGIFGQYMVAKYASQHVDVVLSGEGGDELFGGYARLAMVAGERVPDGYENYVLPDDYPRSIEAALRYDLADLPGLLEVDAMATAPFGLRSVAPMTDIRVVAYVLSRPAQDRLGKKMLRSAVRGLVPDEIIARTDKRGFPIPVVEWAQGPLCDWFCDRLGSVPDPEQPWSRKWWYDLCAGQTALV